MADDFPALERPRKPLLEMGPKLVFAERNLQRLIDECVVYVAWATS